MSARRRFPVFLCFASAILALQIAGMQNPPRAAQPPEREIVAAFEYPVFTISSDRDAEVDLVLKNKGTRDETVFLEITEKPEGWQASFTSYGKTVGGVFVEADSKKTVTFEAEETDADNRLTPGTYRFGVVARSPDGTMRRSASLALTVVAAEEKKKQEKAVTLSTAYPVLRGPSDSTFEFSINVTNESEEDGLFNLQAEAPRRWETTFKPAYEDKQISSLNIKANQSKSVKIEVTPPGNAPTGQYPIKVRVWKGESEATTTLKVELTGTYGLSCNTPSGLLSAEAERGGKAVMSVLVRNTGSAVQDEISFLSFKPENWEMQFKPEKVTNLEPGATKQVEVSILPPEDALVGDYSVAVKAQGERASDRLEFRITVKASAAWGWIGVGIIILVIIGLAVTFKTLGRR